MLSVGATVTDRGRVLASSLGGLSQLCELYYIEEMQCG